MMGSNPMQSYKNITHLLFYIKHDNMNHKVLKNNHARHKMISPMKFDGEL
jgi:hypothetical protein